jgi:hypothetical protein
MYDFDETTNVCKYFVALVEATMGFLASDCHFGAQFCIQVEVGSLMWTAVR